LIRLRPKEWSIRLHLFAFAALILVPLILVGSFFATEFAERERERYKEVAKALAADIAADVDRELDSTIAALQALSTSPALRNGDLEAFDRQARETLHYRGSAIAARDQTGQQIINTYAPWGRPCRRARIPCCGRPSRWLLRRNGRWCPISTKVPSPRRSMCL
jgi:hypothetical protein